MHTRKELKFVHHIKDHLLIFWPSHLTGISKVYRVAFVFIFLMGVWDILINFNIIIFSILLSIVHVFRIEIIIWMAINRDIIGTRCRFFKTWSFLELVNFLIVSVHIVILVAPEFDAKYLEGLSKATESCILKLFELNFTFKDLLVTQAKNNIDIKPKINCVNFKENLLTTLQAIFDNLIFLDTYLIGVPLTLSLKCVRYIC